MKRKSILIMVGILLTLGWAKTPNVFATSSTTYVSLTDENITVNESTISENTSENVYASSYMNNGGLSDEAKEANIEIKNVININKSGTYEFTGELSDGQISVNANEINGDVIIVLNNATITCKNAPAIFVYNKDIQSTKCNVIIKTTKNSTNTISGGKIKQSVEGWVDQTEVVYHVEKGYNDEGEYYERYKYDGAISSDISLTFEGEGTLIVNSIKKEGIETKKDITINSGIYIINALDDGINACADGESVITINGGTVLANVTNEAEEGDGIDSNGFIYINGGNVYAFASETSQDSGLDSDLGIYINGGTVVGTGNMQDAVSNESKQNFLQLQFRNKVEKDTLITITDSKQNPIVAFKTDRTYSVLTISTEQLDDNEFKVYEGGEIEGTSINGLYTEIISYTAGTEKEYNSMAEMDSFGRNINRANYRIYYYIMIIGGIILVITIIVAVVTKKKGKNTVLVLTGVLIGIIITTAGFFIYNVNTIKDGARNGELQMQKMDGMRNMEDMPKMGDMEEAPKMEKTDEKPQEKTV